MSLSLLQAHAHDATPNSSTSDPIFFFDIQSLTRISEANRRTTAPQEGELTNLPVLLERFPSWRELLLKLGRYCHSSHLRLGRACRARPWRSCALSAHQGRGCAPSKGTACVAQPAAFNGCCTTWMHNMCSGTPHLAQLTGKVSATRTRTTLVSIARLG